MLCKPHIYWLAGLHWKCLVPVSLKQDFITVDLISRILHIAYLSHLNTPLPMQLQYRCQHPAR